MSLSPSSLKPAASTSFFTTSSSIRCSVSVRRGRVPAAAAWSLDEEHRRPASAPRRPPCRSATTSRLEAGQVQVVVVLRGPDQVDRRRAWQGRPTVSVVSLTLVKCGSAATPLRASARRRRRRPRSGSASVDVPVRPDRTGEDAGEVAAARDQLEHLLAGLDAGEGQHLGRLARRVAVACRPAGRFGSATAAAMLAGSAPAALAAQPPPAARRPRPRRNGWLSWSSSPSLHLSFPTLAPSF